MSVESLIFLAIFFLLPLIERILKRNRTDQPTPPRPRADVPPPTPGRPVPPPLPVPVETRKAEPDHPPARRDPAPHPRPTAAPRPATAERMPAELIAAIRAREAREKARAQRAALAAAAAAAAPGHRTSARVVSRILRNPRSLRRAVTIAAVLAPCKALERDS